MAMEKITTLFLFILLLPIYSQNSGSALKMKWEAAEEKISWWQAIQNSQEEDEQVLQTLVSSLVKIKTQNKSSTKKATQQKEKITFPRISLAELEQQTEYKEKQALQKKWLLYFMTTTELNEQLREWGLSYSRHYSRVIDHILVLENSLLQEAKLLWTIHQLEEEEQNLVEELAKLENRLQKKEKLDSLPYPHLIFVPKVVVGEVIDVDSSGGIIELEDSIPIGSKGYLYREGKQLGKCQILEVFEQYAVVKTNEILHIEDEAYFCISESEK